MTRIGAPRRIGCGGFLGSIERVHFFRRVGRDDDYYLAESSMLFEEGTLPGIRTNPGFWSFLPTPGAIISCHPSGIGSGADLLVFSGREKPLTVEAGSPKTRSHANHGESGTMGVEARLYSRGVGIGGWTGEHLAVSIYYRREWRRGVCSDLSPMCVFHRVAIADQ